jgi:hypothetical protein
MEQKQPTITDIIKPELPTLTAIISLSNDKDRNTIETIALQELSYLEQHVLDKPDLLNCHPQSIILAVKNVLRKNLTLDPSAGLVYIKTRKKEINGKWVLVLESQETANGLLSYNRQFGRLLDYTNPKVIKDANGKVTGVTMSILKPSFPQPRWEDFEYDESDFRRWAIASHKERGRNKSDADINKLNYANHLYFSWHKGIDPEFARAKCIRHSVKKLGTNPNELIMAGQSPQPVTAYPIDSNIAAAEAEDHDADFTAHEVVDTTINNQNNNTTENETASDIEFNADDL